MGPTGGELGHRPRRLRHPGPAELPEPAGVAGGWSPVRSPSGMILYTAGMRPEWQGDILFGALSAGGWNA